MFMIFIVFFFQECLLKFEFTIYMVLDNQASVKKYFLYKTHNLGILVQLETLLRDINVFIKYNCCYLVLQFTQ